MRRKKKWKGKKKSNLTIRVTRVWGNTSAKQEKKKKRKVAPEAGGETHGVRA